MSLGRTIAMASKLVGGMVSGHFGWPSFQRLLEVSARASKIRALYERFPQQLGGFEEWVAEARALWGEG